jgi:hypothetical protein
MLTSLHLKNHLKPENEAQDGDLSIISKSNTGKYQANSINIEACLNAMMMIERKLDLLSSTFAKKKSFRVVGNWFVSDEIFREWIKFHLTHPTGVGLTGIPGLMSGSIFSIWHHLLSTRRVRVNTSARAILIGRNVRAFYAFPRPLTLWIGLPPIQPELSATIEIRNRFVANHPLRIPRIISQGADADPPYILEEFIDGRRFGQPQDWVSLTDMLLKPLFQLYDHSGIRHRRAVEVYDKQWIMTSIADLIPKLRWKKTWLSKEQLMKSVEESLNSNEETLPLCIGHGDLGKSNLLIPADGGIALLDWERSRELPIAADLIKLICRYHPLAHRIEPELLKRTEDFRSMTTNRQLLLATFNRIAILSSLSKDDSNKRETRRLTARKAQLWLSLATFLTKTQQQRN